LSSQWIIGTIRGDTGISRWAVTWDGERITSGGSTGSLGNALNIREAVRLVREKFSKERDDLDLTTLSLQYID
jgi:hypothetical protein